MASQESFIVDGSEDIEILGARRMVEVPGYYRIVNSKPATVYYDTYNAQIEPDGLDLSVMYEDKEDDY